MPSAHRGLTTGLPELDRLLHGLMTGDNIVWQVNSIDDYALFVRHYFEEARRSGRKIVYFRFATHTALLEPTPGLEICQLRPDSGFEPFLESVHSAIEKAGRGAFYVFDCLTELAADWFSDEMLGNFFQLTCPYLYDMETIAYFALTRSHHSPAALRPIRETTQIMLDVYSLDKRLFVRPIKVQLRNAPALFMLHEWKDDAFHPVLDSCTMAEILNAAAPSALESAAKHMDVWHRAFVQLAETIGLHQRGLVQADFAQLIRRLLRMVFSREQSILALAERYLTVDHLLDIGRRIVGTGLIGGKSAGMLLARAIVERDTPELRARLEPHDSFFIGSDVFYTYLVRNGCWWVRRANQHSETFLQSAQQARRRILTGTFPERILEQFVEILEYYGESPIIVRSSSLLEDSFGNSFAGKYDSVFCTNQGGIAQRLENFISAIKTVYASSIGEEALSYRTRHGLMQRDEQMALLVQRVSGAQHGPYHFPQIAGVGFSHNLFAWSPEIDPEAGMLRLVFGLGTRAVDRIEDDYTRIVPLNAPMRRPDEGHGESTHTQRYVDVIDLVNNQEETVPFDVLAPYIEDIPMDLFAGRDSALLRRAREVGKETSSVPKSLLFENLLAHSPFAGELRTMLRAVQDAYGCPVDVEFTGNFFDAEQFRVNIVQCRPLQTSGGRAVERLQHDVPESDWLLQSRGGPVVGHSRNGVVGRLVYVSPAGYAALPLQDQHAVARLIGKITHLPERPAGSLMLLGPGRWGTSSPYLGVPVKFAEIESVNVLCEIVEMREGLVPEISYGTHFFSEMVEMDMLYLALVPTRAEDMLQRAFFEQTPSSLLELLPEAAALNEVVRVIEPGHLAEPCSVAFHANNIDQRVLCYRDRAVSAGASPGIKS